MAAALGAGLRGVDGRAAHELDASPESCPIDPDATGRGGCLAATPRPYYRNVEPRLTRFSYSVSWIVSLTCSEMSNRRR